MILLKELKKSCFVLEICVIWNPVKKAVSGVGITPFMGPNSLWQLFCTRYGRFTVATLERKVEEYEKEVKQMERALERSDEYVEEMETELEQLR